MLLVLIKHTIILFLYVTCVSKLQRLLDKRITSKTLEIEEFIVNHWTGLRRSFMVFYATVMQVRGLAL